jgi:hypothetical protein
MKATHRGYEISVTREKCLGGWSLLYYSIFRIEDGYEALSSFEDSGHTVREVVGHMKQRIDNELAEDDPWLEREGAAA